MGADRGKSTADHEIDYLRGYLEMSLESPR